MRLRVRPHKVILVRQATFNYLTHVLEMLVWVWCIILGDWLQCLELIPKLSCFFNVWVAAVLPLIRTTLLLVLRRKSWISVAIQYIPRAKTTQWMLAWPVGWLKEVLIRPATCKNVLLASGLFPWAWSRCSITIRVWIGCLVNVLLLSVKRYVNVLHGAFVYF